jgi:3'-5' exoribonuclease
MNAETLSQVEEGALFQGFVLVARKSVRQSASGEPYWDLVLQDASGRLPAKVWGEVLSSHGGIELQEGDTAKVRAVGENYGGRRQVKVLRFRPVRPEDGVDASALLPRSPRDAEAMFVEMMAILDTISDPHLKRLSDSFFREDAAFAEAFKRSSAATRIHHPYVGGMVEHVLSLLRIGSFLASHYPEMNRDLLLVGIVFHDAGKVIELEGLDYSTEGELLGHVAMGYEMVRERMRRLEGFPPELMLQVGHLILSHQGEPEYGTPVVPKTKEALLLHFIDNMDAKMFQCYESLRETGAEGQAFSERNWLLKRRFYRGGAEEQAAPPDGTPEKKS